MLLPKPKQHRDKQWLLAQREMPCMFTGASEVEVAHIRLGSHAGTGQKPSDYATVPLHYALHKEQHRTGEKSFYLSHFKEYPSVMMECVLSFAKLRYLEYLAENGREQEIMEVLK